jgi:hypothetical protein
MMILKTNNREHSPDLMPNNTMGISVAFPDRYNCIAAGFSGGHGSYSIDPQHLSNKFVQVRDLIQFFHRNFISWSSLQKLLS